MQTIEVTENSGGKWMINPKHIICFQAFGEGTGIVLSHPVGLIYVKESYDEVALKMAKC